MFEFSKEIKSIIVDDHILILHPTNNGITKIGFPNEERMSWMDAIYGQKYGWKLPTIEELEFVYQIYVSLKNNGKLDCNFIDPFWSLTTVSLCDKNATALDFNSGKRIVTDKNYPFEVIYVYHEKV